MYPWHRPASRTRPFSLLLIAAVILTATFGIAGPARAIPVDCEHAIVKATTKFVQIRMKRLQKCRDQILADRMPQPCPNLPTQVKLDSAALRLRTAVMKKCGGGDRICGTIGDETLSSIGWDMGSCPGFEDSPCTNTITNCNHISTCVECVGNRVVDQALSLYYDAFDLDQTRLDVVRCQRALGKKAAILFKGLTQTRRKCETRVLAGITTGPCPDGIAAAKITRLTEKFRKFTCKACGGDDRECNDIQDLNPGLFGAPSDCPDVQIPGGAACGGPLTTLTDVVDCEQCVTEFKAACLDALTVPRLESYPPECLATP